MVVQWEQYTLIYAFSPLKLLSGLLSGIKMKLILVVLIAPE